MPASADADAAYAELRKLPSVPPPTAVQLKTRADGLMSRKRYADAADEYRALVNEIGPNSNSTERSANTTCPRRRAPSRRQEPRREDWCSPWSVVKAAK